LYIVVETSITGRTFVPIAMVKNGGGNISSTISPFIKKDLM